MSETQIEVSQRAREAAADWAKMQSRHAQAANMRRGSCDTAPLVQLFARFERDILATRTDATPVAFISAERLNRKREFESNGAVVYDRPLGTSTMPLYTHPPATDVAALVEAAEAVDLCFFDESYPECVDLRQALAPFTKGQP